MGRRHQRAWGIDRVHPRWYTDGMDIKSQLWKAPAEKPYKKPSLLTAGGETVVFGVWCPDAYLIKVGVTAVSVKSAKLAAIRQEARARHVRADKAKMIWHAPGGYGEAAFMQGYLALRGGILVESRSVSWLKFPEETIAGMTCKLRDLYEYMKGIQAT